MPESLALLGRLEKDNWINSWRDREKTPEEMFKTAAGECYLLKLAIDPYLKAFRRQPDHFFSGINALTLLHLLAHTTGIEEQSELCRSMEGGLRWVLKCELDKNKKNYWAQVTLGDLQLLLGKKKDIKQAYKRAIAVADNNWFSLDSTRQQLRILQDLKFRPDEVEMALEMFNSALGKLDSPWEPRQVILFSGHMIDVANRKSKRFPLGLAKDCKAGIVAKLSKLKAGPSDMALCGGACGGDIIFAESCLELGLKVEIRIPFEEPYFIKNSVVHAGEAWRDRFNRIKQHPNSTLLIAPNELGEKPEDVDPYERNNAWQLYTTIAWGAEKIQFICLWDGQSTGGPGGTKHMVETVEQRSGQIHIIDIKKLLKKYQSRKVKNECTRRKN